jgi:hypothetical protein
MRKILLAAGASIALVSATGLVASRADAMTLTTPSGVRSAAASTDLAQDVRWVCRYNWWSGRRHCWWEPRRRHWRYRHW